MQTFSVQIEDNYMQQFMNFVNKSHSNIIITKDNNLELDPYFYERQKKLHRIRDEIKSGKMELLSEEEAEREMELFFKKLEQ